MSPLRRCRTLSTALALGLGLGAPSLAHAQQTNPGNTNISTGSGAGTSAGVSPGASPSSTNLGNANLRSPSPGLGPQGTPGSRPPGANPGQALPAAIDNQPQAPYSQAEVNAIDARMLQDMRAVANPADRAMGMDQVALAKISAHGAIENRPDDALDTLLNDAHLAVAEGGVAALQVADRVTRDIRLRLLVRTALLLADEQTRVGMTDTTDPKAVRDPRIWTARRRFDWLQRAETERRAAGELASRITNPTLRSEMLFRVVDNTSQGSQTIAQQALLVDGKRSDLSRVTDVINRMADRGLVFAANDAERIAKPIWRDRAMVSIAIAAAASEQFDRGVEICRTIPQPEYRADALIRLAENQARRNQNAAATSTYRDAASAVASIPIGDPRSTLASVLIDSLISVGRFDDARACVPFYPDGVRRMAALGTIAGNQGERRLAPSALAWIESDAPPELRDTLKLRVYQGVLRSYEKSRPPSGNAADPGAR